MKANEIFNEYLPKKLTASNKYFDVDALKGKSVGLDLEGPDGGAWTLAIDSSGSASVAPGLAPGTDCIIHMNESVFEGLLKGSVNVPMAVLTRKIKIKGETTVAAKLGLALQKIMS